MGYVKIYQTLIKADHQLSTNEYVQGRISGIMVGLDAKVKKAWANIHTTNGDFILVHECSARTYNRFKKVVEQHYPGLCIFDYHE